MNLRALETLLAVADRGGFAAAADRMGITQSAVSMQMKGLEDELGAPLFDRSRRPPALNELGREILEQAREISRLGDGIRALAAGTRVQGRLRLGVIPTAASGLVPDALAQLAHRAPDVQVRIESGLSPDLTRRVSQGILDAAVITQTSRLERGLISRTVLEEPLVVVAREDLKGSDAPSLLRQYPFVRFTRRTGVGRIIDATLRQRRIPVQEAMELDSIEAILAMVSRGLGVAVVPEGPVRSATLTGVRTIDFAGKPTLRRVGLVMKEPAKDLAMMEMLFSELKSSASIS